MGVFRSDGYQIVFDIFIIIIKKKKKTVVEEQREKNDGCLTSQILIFRKRNGPGETVRRRSEKRRSEVHENRATGHRFQAGEVRLQDQRLHKPTKRHWCENY